MTALPTSSARRPVPIKPLLIRGAILCAVPIVIIALALGPQRLAWGGRQLMAMHAHPPNLAPLAAASLPIKIHLASIAVALVIGMVLMIGVKGSRLHRVLGWTWVLAMATTAVSSLFIRELNPGRFSLIHLLTGWTVISLPMAVFWARTHRVNLHARVMTSLFTGGLLLAGVIAFAPGRLMWRMVFG